MDLLKVLLIAGGCIILGIAGGFAARSVWAGLILAVFVFIGWLLWRAFKFQNGDQKPVEAQEEKKEE
ncbi:MAG: hypothetical protein PHP08_02200 [Candidatus Dojkabacteria bacterium]|nr:hypothetical protein [Candidatus Dojkabacteria bacterium]